MDIKKDCGFMAMNKALNIDDLSLNGIETLSILT